MKKKENKQTGSTEAEGSEDLDLEVFSVPVTMALSPDDLLIQPSLPKHLLCMLGI